MRRVNRFIPSLLTKIQQSIFQVRISFRKDVLVFTSQDLNLEYADGKFVSHTFLRAGIGEIVLKEFLSRTAIEQLRKIFEFAEEGKITQVLPENLRQIEAIEKINEISNEEIGFIPGCYKHYTSYQNYQGIIRERKIMAKPHRKNGQERVGVYLTGLSLSPLEAFEIIFIGNPEYRDRSTHVIAFDILDPEFERKIEKNGIEFFVGESINLDAPGVKVKYHGPNFQDTL